MNGTGLTVTANVTWNGKPLAVLSSLIEKRKRLMGEMTCDAVTAVAIDALNSVRALTRRASEKHRPKVTVEATPYFGGWRHGVGYCILDAAGNGGHRVSALAGRRVVWHMANDVPWNQKRVWKVVGEKGGEYYFVGRSADDAKRYERERTRRRIARRGGLAKNALAVAMHGLSTRSPRMEGGEQGRSDAQRLGWAKASYSGDFFMVQAGSRLDYGLDALKGGSQAIDMALKKAANRVAAIISRKAGLPFEERIPTPFPEVSARVRRQRTA